jgi:hypothetical protein
MKCREVRMTLVAFLDHEVGPSERAAIDAHLAQCGSCDKERLALARTRANLADGIWRLASQAAPSKIAWSRLQARIEKEGSSPAEAAPRKARSRPAMTRRWRIALAVSGVILLAVCLVAAVPSSRSAAGGLLANIFNWHRFVPVEAGYLPEGFDPAPVYQVGLVGVPLASGAEGGREDGSQVTRTEQSLYRGGGLFVLVRIVSDTGEPLPEGEAAEVNGNDAVLLVGLSGFVPTPEDLQEDEGTPATADQRYSVTYRDANTLTWIQGDTRVEVLSNLSVEETRKVAEGLVIGKIGESTALTSDAAVLTPDPIPVHEDRLGL